MNFYRPEKIFVEKQARELPATERILSRLPGIPVEEIEEPRLLVREVLKNPEPIGKGKKYLLLARDQGRSFKPFPESEQYLSCDYFTLHVAEGCDLECSYCILQAYLTNPVLTVYVNIEEMLEQLQTVLDRNPDQFFRIGTGQLADSLSLDHLTGFSELLVPFFAKQKNAVLELKTKSGNIERLLPLSAEGNTIVSWSMNSKKVQRKEEHKCASIEERIAAAQRLLINSGYRVGFHFDPVIDYEGWEAGYSEVLEELFSQIPQNRVAWLSLGCLRMMPALKPIMQERFPRSALPSAEWIRGMDGKLRYFKPRRVQIYQTLLGRVRKLAPGITVYLCMETPDVWEQVFGTAWDRKRVCRHLDTAAIA